MVSPKANGLEFIQYLKTSKEKIMKRVIHVLLGFILLNSCQNNASLGEESPNAPIEIKEIPLYTESSGEPNLFVSASGQLYISWIENLNDSLDALQFSKLENGQWTAPQEVASGQDWFVNWADFPALAVYADNEDHMAAHWLQKSAGGTYDYDVKIAQSSDGGQSWSAPFIPHTDGISAEHGFVSFLPLSEGQMMACWLDGRNTKKEGGAMTLRAAEFSIDGTLFEEYELDHRICDCCQTGTALTEEGPVVVYRDRSEGEIRDIYITRKVAGQWQEPKPVFQDNWLINGCPVNGPAIDAWGNRVVVAWYAMPEGERQVKVAFSEDAGATFQPPVRIDNGNPEGRVDVLWLDDGRALVSWLENLEEGKAAIQMAVVNPGMDKSETISLAATSASRSSGFPRIAKVKDEIFLAWTAVEGKKTKVTTARLNTGNISSD